MRQLCEACECNAAEKVDSSDNPTHPYFVCVSCYDRLHARALRPVEWFNLAKRHGWHSFLLHDDFYEEDGTATQPEDPVERPHDLLAPTLAEVAGDPKLLLDYSITRWHLNSKIVSAWRGLDPTKCLSALSDRYGSTQSIAIRSRILEICASALSHEGAAFVRYVWGDFPSGVDLPSLAQASATCLPFREGFDRVTAALDKETKPDRRNLMLSLSYFHSPETLDWIERNIFEPITESWGYLAAASQLAWPRVERWFSQGRPMSLVAIDALAAIASPQTPLLRSYRPRLYQAPSSEEFRQVLSAYAERDRVPRVQQRTSALLTHTETLTRADRMKS